MGYGGQLTNYVNRTDNPNFIRWFYCRLRFVGSLKIRGGYLKSLVRFNFVLARFQMKGSMELRIMYFATNYKFTNKNVQIHVVLFVMISKSRCVDAFVS